MFLIQRLITLRKAVLKRDTTARAETARSPPIISILRSTSIAETCEGTKGLGKLARSRAPALQDEFCAAQGGSTTTRTLRVREVHAEACKARENLKI